LTKPIPLRFSPEDDIRLAVDKRKCVQRFAQHDIKGRSRGRQGIVMSLCSGRSNLRKRDGSLEVVACSDPDPQAVVLVECRGGEESSTASLKAEVGMKRSDGHIAGDEEWEEGAHMNDGVVREGRLGVGGGTLPSWPAVVAHRHR
jgi:hypothetical protein